MAGSAGDTARGDDGGDATHVRYRALFDQHPDGLCEVDLDGRFLVTNSAMHELTGYSPDELAGTRFLVLVHPDERDRVSARFTEALDGSPSTYETIGLHKDGRTFPVTITSIPIVVDDAVVGVLGVARDVTAAKHARARLERNRSLLRIAGRKARLGGWAVDAKTLEVFWSDEIFEILDFPPAAPYPTIEEGLATYRDEHREQVRDAVLSCLRDGTPFDIEVDAFTATERRITVRVVGEARIGIDGEVEEVIGAFQDISELRSAHSRTAEAVQELAEKAALLDEATDAIVVQDLDQTVTFWNRGAELLYGWSAEEAIGRPVNGLLGEDGEAGDVALATTLTTGEWIGELAHRTRDGSPLTVQARWTLVHDEDGAPRSVLAINTDITERKRLEQQFLRVQRMESLGTLAGGIAHDLNNVLTPVMMSIELLEMGESDERRLELLRTIEASTERGAEMIKQVLSFARGVEGSHQQLDVATLLRDVRRILQDTLPRTIDLKVETGHDLWPIAGESTQLHQVLINLAVNARDAMPDGGSLRLSAVNVTLDEPYAALTHGAHPGPYVRIQVEDDGIGMSPEVTDRIFEPFFTTKPQGEGSGLGLSTSLAIVMSHGGFLRVYSEPGQGTTFKLYLPALTTAHDLAAPESAAQELPRGHGELILVVDDEAAVRDITRQTLEAFGYRVLEAADGSEALSLFLEHRGEIDLVLTDMMMPVMDGPATIRALFELDPDVTIIAASGLNADGKVASPVEDGVEHFLPKPYTAETLLTRVRNALPPTR